MGNSIFSKMDLHYLLQECFVLICIISAASIAIIPMSTKKQVYVKINRVENLSSTYFYSFSPGHYKLLRVKLSATVKYKDTKEFNKWAFQFRTAIISKDNKNYYSATPKLEDIKNNRLESFVFLQEDFEELIDPKFEMHLLTRNPDITEVIFYIEYTTSTRFDSKFIAFASLLYIFFIGKSFSLLLLILSYFATFFLATDSYKTLSYTVYYFIALNIIMRHTCYHAANFRFVARVVLDLTYALPSLSIFVALILFFVNRLDSLIRSPLFILIGVGILQTLWMLTGDNYTNKEVLFDMFGFACIFIPFVLKVYLPIYISTLRAVEATNRAAIALSFFAIMCLIISESFVGRNVNNLKYLGIIKLEGSSSSYEPVELEEMMQPETAQKFDILALLTVALAAIISIANMMYGSLPCDIGVTFKYVQDLL